MVMVQSTDRGGRLSCAVRWPQRARATARGSRGGMPGNSTPRSRPPIRCPASLRTGLGRDAGQMPSASSFAAAAVRLRTPSLRKIGAGIDLDGDFLQAQPAGDLLVRATLARSAAATSRFPGGQRFHQFAATQVPEAGLAPSASSAGAKRWPDRIKLDGAGHSVVRQIAGNDTRRPAAQEGRPPSFLRRRLQMTTTGVSGGQIADLTQFLDGHRSPVATPQA